MDKARILGVEDLNPTEMAALPFLCVFYELIEFYLETTTQAGIGRNLMHYNEELVRQFAFNQEDLNASAQFLESAGLCDRLTEWLKKADSDRNGFARFWIQYVSMRSGERLYSILMGTLTARAKDYPTQAMPVAYEKHNPSIRRFVNDCFGRCKWYGEFPYFYRSRPCKFLETSNVCGKMYSYINEKEKAFYVDFVEGFDGQTYSLTAIAGYVLLRNDENTQDYQAMSGYFLDDGRRFSHVVGQINMDYRTESREIGEALEAMIADAMGIYG